jgi:hypothetical protein
LRAPAQRLLPPLRRIVEVPWNSSGLGSSPSFRAITALDDVQMTL